MSHKSCGLSIKLENYHVPKRGRYCNAVVDDRANKKLYIYDCKGNYVSWNTEGGSGPTPTPEEFSVTIPFSNPQVGSHIVWTADRRATALHFLALRTGGIGATVNVMKNGVEMLATDLSLAAADGWLEGAPLTNTSFQVGDTLSFVITALAGDVDSISFSMEFIENV